MPRRTIGAFVAVALLLAVPVIAGASGSATPPHPASPVIAGASG